MVAIAAGVAHCLALKLDGTVVAWGANSSGQSSVPPGLSNVVAIAAGSDYSLALKSDGKVTAWGDGLYHQTDIPPSASNAVAISAFAGGATSLALIGEGPPFITSQPMTVRTYSGLPVLLRASASGTFPLSYQWRHNGTNVPFATNSFLLLDYAQSSDAGSYALTVTNSLGTAGSHKATLTVTDSAPLLAGPMTNQMAYIGKSILLQPWVGGSAPLVYRWQHNGRDLPGRTTPGLVINPTLAKDEGQYTLIISNRFGIVTNSASLSVSPIVGWPGELYPPAGVTDIVSVATEVNFSLCVGLQRNGSLVAWDSLSNPVQLPAEFTNVHAIAAGYGHLLGLKGDNTVISWGNSYGQIDVPPGLSNIISIAAGPYCSFAVRSDGSALGWGKLGYTPADLLPVTVPSGLTNLTRLAPGFAHVMGLNEDGTVAVWGDNSYGQTNLPANL